MTAAIVTLDTLSLLLEELLRQHCAVRGADFEQTRRALFSNTLNKDDALDKQAFEMEDWLRQQCAAREVDYAEMRAAMFLRWLENRTESSADPLRQLLDQAFACQRQSDSLGYRDACLAWLKQAHDLALGELVRVGVNSDARVIRIEDFSIAVESQSLSASTVSFIGPCVSHRADTRRHRWQFITEPIEKFQETKVKS